MTIPKGGRSASPQHPSRKHDVERELEQQYVDISHAQPVRLSYNGGEVLYLPRRRMRRHPDGSRKATLRRAS